MVKRCRPRGGQKNGRLEAKHRRGVTKKNQSIQTAHKLSSEKTATLEVIKQLRDCYEPRYAFPEWCFAQRYSQLHLAMCKKSRVVGRTRDIACIRGLLYQRQPVNIMMETTGVQWPKFQRLQRSLHEARKLTPQQWRNSLYTQYWQQKEILAPSLAVYCETPVGIPGKKLDSKALMTIRVLNLIGLGFDNSRQPDHQASAQHKGKHAWLRPRIRAQLQQIQAVIRWAATNGQPIQYLHLPDVGCGHFAGNMPVQRVWDELCLKTIPRWRSMYPDLFVTRDNIYAGSFQSSLNMMKTWKQLDASVGLQRCLFVNAWDPHSLIGNGNAADASLDGWYGRHSALAVLGWPGTNPYLLNSEQFIKV